MLRMRLKKGMEEGEDLEVMSLGLERLSRAIGVKHKVSPKQLSDEYWDNFEEVLEQGYEMFFPPGTEKPHLPPEGTE
jgi:hypothetical protein